MPSQFGREDRLVVTMWHTVRRFLLVVVILAIAFTLYSAGVAIATADKCGQIHASKDWHYLPPRWDCNTNP
jgi:hypothetical protein